MPISVCGADSTPPERRRPPSPAGGRRSLQWLLQQWLAQQRTAEARPPATCCVCSNSSSSIFVSSTASSADTKVVGNATFEKSSTSRFESRSCPYRLSPEQSQRDSVAANGAANRHNPATEFTSVVGTAGLRSERLTGLDNRNRNWPLSNIHGRKSRRRGSAPPSLFGVDSPFWGPLGHGGDARPTTCRHPRRSGQRLRTCSGSPGTSRSWLQDATLPRGECGLTTALRLEIEVNESRMWVGLDLSSGEPR